MAKTIFQKMDCYNKKDAFYGPLKNWLMTNIPNEASAKAITGNAYVTMSIVANAVLGYICDPDHRPEDLNDYTLVKVMGNANDSSTLLAMEQPIRNKSDNKPTGRYLVAMWSENNGGLKLSEVDENGRVKTITQQLADVNWQYPVEGLFGILLQLSLNKHPEYQQTLDVLKASYEIGGQGGSKKITDVYDQNVIGLIDLVDYCLEHEEIKISTSVSTGSHDHLPKDKLKGDLMGTVLCGPAPHVLFGSQKDSKTKTIPMKEAKEMFKDWADAQNWTEDEKALIPSEFDDEFQLDPNAVQIARMIVNSTKFKKPIRQVCWRGPTGVGKSTSCRAIAQMLNMPYVTITCHSTMETQDFLSDFVPATGTTASGSLPELDYDEIGMFPAECYKRITGKEKEDATPSDCITAYVEAAAAEKSSGGAQFKLVESEYVKALKNGWIVEIAEISRIRDAGVLVGLNDFDRAGSRIPLVDGSFAHRADNAIVIFTDNVGYNSCRDVDPSVQRRMFFTIDSKELTKENAIKRIQSNSGYKDVALLSKMYDAWQLVKEYCETHDITAGTVSICELENWVICYLADGESNLKEHFEHCVISKATSDQNEQAELRNTANTSSVLFI